MATNILAKSNSIPTSDSEIGLQQICLVKSMKAYVLIGVFLCRHDLINLIAMISIEFSDSPSDQTEAAEQSQPTDPNRSHQVSPSTTQ